MGYTIGDVLTVIALISGSLFSIWATLVGFALLFPKKAQSSRVNIEGHPVICFMVGAFTALIGWTLVIILLNLHNPLVTLLGWLGAVAMLVLQAIGGSGLALLSASRIQKTDRRRSSYRSLERGAMLLVVGGLVPIFGWFFFTPVVNIISLGAGLMSVLQSRRASAEDLYTEPVKDFNTNGASEFIV